MEKFRFQPAEISANYPAVGQLTYNGFIVENGETG